jgi:phage tail-like protein
VAEPTYRYLGLTPGAWPGCSRTGLADDADFAVRLAPLQGDPVALGADAAGALAGAAGIGVAPDGTIYVADPAGSRILVIACDGSVEPVACLCGPGPEVGQLDDPQAVLVGPRDALYIADTGNQRVVVIDLASGVITGVFGGFVAPVDLAVDSSDRLYVADRDAPAVVRMDLDGNRDAFAVDVVAPKAVATLEMPAGERLLVVDGGAAPALKVFTLDGQADAAMTAELAQVAADDIVQATSDGSALYVAGPGGVLAFALDGTLLGPVADVHGAASGLGLDCMGRLVVSGGGGVARLDTTRRSAFGQMLLGPLELAGDADHWDRVAVELLDPLPDGAHLRIWTLTTAAAATPALPPTAPPPGEVSARTLPGLWRAAPLDATDTLVLHEPAPKLWVCVDLTGDGTATPAVRAVRVDFLAGGLPAHLPEIYNANDATETVWRLVNLLAAPLDELDAAITDLPRLFDADAAPDRTTAPWLDALAVWVAQPLEIRYPEDLRRSLVAGAFVQHGLRGTRSSLEAVLTLAADAPVTVTENAADASLWQLGGDASVLGFTTMLTPFEAQGAVVGTTAEVDRSHLIDDEDVGWPLDADVAHRFCVHVAAVDLAPERESGLLAAIETEKPAHTVAHLCVIEPQTTVGFHCRIGIDMMVGGDPPTLRLGMPLDGEAALRATSRSSGVGSRIDETNRVGRIPALVPGGR